MGFLKPDVPTPPPAPNTPVAANSSTFDKLSTATGLGSLISTGTSGLKRKADVQKTSLIGGS